MATKKKLTEAQLNKIKADNAVVYKVIIAMVLLCLTVIGLRELRAFYATLGGVMALFDRLTMIIVSGFVLAAVGAVLLVVLRKRAVRVIFPWITAAGLLIALTAITMKTTVTEQFPLLYFLCAAAFILYIIFQLYRWEFFLFSLTTLATGGGFFAFSRGYNLSNGGVWFLLVLIAAWLVTSLLAFLGAKNKGRIRVGKLAYPMFSAKYNPMPLYLVNGLWVVCTIVGFVFGSLFCYYCMFVAIAIEFIAAVYYTFQLK